MSELERYGLMAVAVVIVAILLISLNSPETPVQAHLPLPGAADENGLVAVGDEGNSDGPHGKSTEDEPLRVKVLSAPDPAPVNQKKIPFLPDPKEAGKAKGRVQQEEREGRAEGRVLGSQGEEARDITDHREALSRFDG